MRTGWHTLGRRFCVLTLIAAGMGSAVAATPPQAFTVENDLLRLSIDPAGRVKELALHGGVSLLGQPDAPCMYLNVGKAWRPAASLAAAPEKSGYRLHVTFTGTPVQATLRLAVHPRWLEVETIGLDGPGAEAIEQWAFINLPVNLHDRIGGWLNVASTETAAAAVLALDERTNAGGTPLLRATAVGRLGMSGRKAAIVGCPTPQFLDIVRQLEEHSGLPSPQLGGQWAKTSQEVRKSWMITGMTAASDTSPYSVDRVFETAEALGVKYVILALSSWNTTYGHYAINRKNFPAGAASLKAVADKAHARGLKLGLHVMSSAVTPNDAYVTPKPDPRLEVERELTLASPLDASARSLDTREPPVGFGTSKGYWAYAGTEVRVDDEIISYSAVRSAAPFGLADCVRGAHGTQAAPHGAGAKIKLLTQRYGWYVASPELAREIGENLARLINEAGLDAVCFDGADITADPQTKFFAGHQVPLAIYRNARRDVLQASNGTTHFGWHLMARGGEDDAMARGFQGWVDHHTVHAWGAAQIRSFMPPDFSWIGIFPQSPTMTAARPDDLELVCARCLGYDAPVGWGFAACFGGPSSVASFERNGRRSEMAELVRTYERLRLGNDFAADQRAPLQALGSHWRLAPPREPAGRYRLVPADYLGSEIIRPAAAETARWDVQNRLGEQPLRMRIEALPALASYGSTDNVVLADFSQLAFTPAGKPAANPVLEKTSQQHPQAGAVARLACRGPAAGAAVASKVVGHSLECWARASAEFPQKLDLRKHRALGLWIHGDGGGEVLNVQLDIKYDSCLHFYQPIDFTGWKYCELGAPEGDRVMDYFAYEKFALHEVPLNQFAGLTLMILNPPRGKSVELLVGRIEALRELGGQLVNPQLTLPGGTLRLPVSLAPGEYLETGDPWGTRQPSVCRVFDAAGSQLQRRTIEGGVPRLPAGKVTVRFSAEGTPPARAKVTIMPEGLPEQSSDKSSTPRLP